MPKWLKTLKTKLKEEKDDLGDIMSFFFDSTEANPEFLGRGKQSRDPLLDSILSEIAKTLFGKNSKVQQALCVRLPDDQFIHGTCMIEGKMGNYFYFEDIEMGLVAIIMSFSSSKTQFARFSRVQGPSGSYFSLN
jgi:hypothetical protein